MENSGSLTSKQIETRLGAIGCQLHVNIQGRLYHVYICEGQVLRSYQRGDFSACLEAAVPEAEEAVARSRSTLRQ